jgi:hypothetical protein
MNWLATYSEHTYRAALYAIQAHDQGMLNDSALIDKLDNVLNIWVLPAECWGDSYLNEWALLFQKYGGAIFAEQVQLSAGDHERITRAVEDLKKRLSYAYAKWEYRGAIATIDVYRHQQMSALRLSHTLLGLASVGASDDDLESYIIWAPNESRDATYDLEDLSENATWYEEHLLRGEWERLLGNLINRIEATLKDWARFLDEEASNV